MLRRSFLKSLIAAPAVISIPGLLMPVKAIPLPWAYVTCVRADGTELIQPVWDQIAPVNILNLPFMGYTEKIVFKNGSSTQYDVIHTEFTKNPVIQVCGIEYPNGSPWGKPLSEFSPKGPDIHWEIKSPAETAKNFAVIEEFKAWELFTFAAIDELKANEAEKEVVARNAAKREKAINDWFGRQ
jgi:hypothetical protein